MNSNMHNKIRELDCSDESISRFLPLLFSTNFFSQQDDEWNRITNSNSSRDQRHSDDVSRDGYYGPSNDGNTGSYSNSGREWKCLEVKKQHTNYFLYVT